VVAHADRAPTPEQMVPADTAALATNEVVPRDGSPAPKAVSEVNMSTAEGVVAATSATVVAAKGPAKLYSIMFLMTP
jgi:hypothetical protein